MKRMPIPEKQDILAQEKNHGKKGESKKRQNSLFVK